MVAEPTAFSHRRCYLIHYPKNSRLRDWWGRMRPVVWGPSPQLLSVDRELQEGLEDLEAAGVELLACKARAYLYG